MMKKVLKRMLLIGFVIAVLYQIMCLSECEILTNRYYSEFEYAYRDNTMLGDMEYFKVLECDGEEAKVYYVSKGRTNGDVLTFEKINGEWEEIYWESIWSSSGSASDVIWPYWWHFIYGGL